MFGYGVVTAILESSRHVEIDDLVIYLSFVILNRF